MPIDYNRSTRPLREHASSKEIDERNLRADRRPTQMHTRSRTRVGLQQPSRNGLSDRYTTRRRTQRSPRLYSPPAPSPSPTSHTRGLLQQIHEQAHEQHAQNTLGDDRGTNVRTTSTTFTTTAIATRTANDGVACDPSTPPPEDELRQLYEEGKELELQRLESVQSSVQHKRAQLEGQLQLLDAATQDMHQELELVNDPVVSQHFPERCEQSREALAEAIRDTSLPDERMAVQQDLRCIEQQANDVALEIERIRTEDWTEETTDIGAHDGGHHSPSPPLADEHFESEHAATGEWAYEPADDDEHGEGDGATGEHHEQYDAAAGEHDDYDEQYAAASEHDEHDDVASGQDEYNAADDDKGDADGGYGW